MLTSRVRWVDGRQFVAEGGSGHAIVLDTVVFGRRGVGAVRGILLGSVAVKLATVLTGLPLWVVGKDPVL